MIRLTGLRYRDESFYDLQAAYCGLKYVKVYELAEEGNRDAILFQIAENEFCYSIGMLFSEKLAGLRWGDPREEEFLSRQLPFYCRKRIIFRSRWHMLEYHYNERRREFYEWGDIIRHYSPTRKYFLYYVVLLPTAFFLAWAEHRWRKNDRIGQDRAQILARDIRAEIERDLLDGITTDTDEQTLLINGLIESYEEDSYFDPDEQTIEGLYMGRKARTRAIGEFLDNEKREKKSREKTAVKAMHSDAFQDDETENRIMDNETASIAMQLFRRLPELDQAIMLASEYGELRELARERGINEKSLSKRKSRLREYFKVELGKNLSYFTESNGINNDGYIFCPENVTRKDDEK